MLGQAWLLMVLAGTLMGVVGGGGATLFSICDDHLKARHANKSASDPLCYTVQAAVTSLALHTQAPPLLSTTTTPVLLASPSSAPGLLQVNSIPFDIWTLRVCAWILSVLPSVVLLLTMRLSLLPLIAFRSLSSEHANHHAFFSALFRFLRGDAEEPGSATSGAEVRGEISGRGAFESSHRVQRKPQRRNSRPRSPPLTP